MLLFPSHWLRTIDPSVPILGTHTVCIIVVIIVCMVVIIVHMVVIIVRMIVIIVAIDAECFLACGAIWCCPQEATVSFSLRQRTNKKCALKCYLCICIGICTWILSYYFDLT